MAVARRRRLFWMTATPVAAVAALVVTTLPGGPQPLSGPPQTRSDGATVLAGAIHVHTVRSDGTGTPDEIAAAAARAGLQFVIFTDHGDGTHRPDPPVYRAGVLCLDAVEISTTGGHYVALGLARTPYPLAGEPRDVVEDVARLGGFGIVAHPDSPKNPLRWRDWAAPVDGLEWLNADSEWRDEAPARLLLALGHYPFRPSAALTHLFSRPVATLERWDALAGERRVVGVPGTDAHARIGFGSADPYQHAVLLRLPSYEVMFRAFAVRVVLEEPPSGDAAADGEKLLGAIRAGHLYSAVDALASPGRFEFEAASGTRSAVMGEELTVAGPVRVRAAADAPTDARLVLLRDGVEVASGPPGTLEHEGAAAPGVFRIEVRLARAPGRPPLPWIVSNPIYVRPATGERPSPEVAVTRRRLLETSDASAWRVERSTLSRADVDTTPTVAGREIAFRWALGSSASGEYAAAALDLTGAEASRYDRVALLARSDRPMRASIQIRLPGEPDGERWQRSVYLDQTPRNVIVAFDEMTAAGLTRTRRPDLDRAQALLVVVDTTHTRPGTSGAIWLTQVALEAAGPESARRGDQVRTVRSR